MMVIYHSAQEFIVCSTDDEEAVKASFFKTRKPDLFTRTIVGDFAYVRAAAAKLPDGDAYGAPVLAVSTNLSDLKL